MIKFFRHLRKSLLIENKTSKYFKYAIGEIVLVVIGILIALQINNWNEEKDNKERIKTTLCQIQFDLLNDVREIHPIDKDLHYDIKLIDQFLNNKKPLSYFEKNLGKLGNATLTYDKFVQSNQSFLNLKNQISVIPKEYDVLMFNLNRLYIENAGFLTDTQSELKNETLTYRSSLFKKYNWMEGFWLKGEKTKEVKDYFLKSETNRRQLVSNKVLLQYHQSVIGLVKSHTILCYLIIRDVLNDTSELPAVIKQFKLDYPNHNVDEYPGVYKEQGNPQIIKLEKKHDVMFMIFAGTNNSNVQFEGLMLQERAKDSLMWLLDNDLVLKFKRDSLNQIDGLYFFDIDRFDKEERDKFFYKRLENY